MARRKPVQEEMPFGVPDTRPVPELVVRRAKPGVRGLAQHGRLRCQFVHRDLCQCRNYAAVLRDGQPMCKQHGT